MWRRRRRVCSRAWWSTSRRSRTERPGAPRWCRSTFRMAAANPVPLSASLARSPSPWPGRPPITATPASAAATTPGYVTRKRHESPLRRERQLHLHVHPRGSGWLDRHVRDRRRGAPHGSCSGRHDVATEYPVRRQEPGRVFFGRRIAGDAAAGSGGARQLQRVPRSAVACTARSATTPSTA